MSIPLNIGGTIIQFPSSAAAPNWAPAVIEFAQAVEQVLNSVAGAFDIPVQIYTLPANSNTNVDITNLSFPTSDVRSAIINYAVYRQTDDPGVASNIKTESGELRTVYNENNSSGTKWEITQEGVGNGEISFAITDVGQVTYSTTTMTGSNHSGFIVFYAKSLTNTI